MFEILKDKTICLTRGDIANIAVSANKKDGAKYTLQKGDVVRFRVFKAKDCKSTVICKDVLVEQESDSVTIHLSHAETKLGGIISKPVDYWYEIELNPDTAPQTIIGYDEAGEKIFRLYPEGGDTE